MSAAACQKEQSLASETSTTENASFAGPALDRCPHIWAMNTQGTIAELAWLPIPQAFQYLLVIEPHMSSVGLIQQFTLDGDAERCRVSDLQPERPYQVYLTALSANGTEITTLEYTFDSGSTQKWRTAKKRLERPAE